MQGIQDCLTELDDLRTQVKELLEEVRQEALDWRPVEGEGDPATISPCVIATHLPGSETFWSSELIGGKKINRDRGSECKTTGIGSSELKGKMDKSGRLPRAVPAKNTDQWLRALSGD